MKVHDIRFACVFEGCLRAGKADGVTLGGVTIRAKPMACIFGGRSGVEVRVVRGLGTKKSIPHRDGGGCTKDVKEAGPESPLFIRCAYCSC